MTEGRLILAFGCGGDRDTTKRPAMGTIAAKFADHIIVTNDNPRSEDPEKIMRDIKQGIPLATPVTFIADRRQALTAAIAMAEPHDTIIIAGKGHEDYQEINGIKLAFSDYHICRELMAQSQLLSIN
jgi:UDP-N-acetylmuramoyl-L-alanyl-D-glutamate--2,6-diaminopimelate ligase